MPDPAHRMRAAWFDELGPARDVLSVGEVERPEASAGEVRVRLHASGVNPSDVKARSGVSARADRPARVIPHSDGAGVIDAVGEGVSTRRIGERVWLYNAQWQRANGTAAQWVAVPAEQAVRLSDDTDFAAGACLGIPAITAHRAVTIGPDITGETVLISGGAGAVGAYAVQLAKAYGARVITTVSSPEKAALVTELGADHVIDYRHENVLARVAELTEGHGVERVIEVDFVANEAIVAGALRPHGVAVVYGSGPGAAAIAMLDYARRNTTLHGILCYTLRSADRARAIFDLNAALREGRLRHIIAARFPLEDTVAAHEAVESGRMIGNVVLEID